MSRTSTNYEAEIEQLKQTLDVTEYERDRAFEYINTLRKRLATIAEIASANVIDIPGDRVATWDEIEVRGKAHGLLFDIQRLAEKSAGATNTPRRIRG